MTHRTSHRSGTVRAVVAAAACALLTGCVSMPTDGPVAEPQVSAATDDEPGIAFNPRPPKAGESAPEIVEGFLEAMKATPIGMTVARQFLSQGTADTWAPEQIITYAEPGTATGVTTVRKTLTDVNLYDERGAWQRTQAERILEVGLVQEDGEWRIESVPDALIVPDSWFDDWYQRASLYYFDPTSEVLVAEPVFAPRGDQLASSLVRGLVTQPPAELQDVVRTYFPAGTRDGLSVPIVAGGIAAVSLSGDPAAVDDETDRGMLAQLVWTLRQEPQVRAVQLTVGGRAVNLAEGSSQGNLDAGDGFDPDGTRPVRELFALDEGRVVTGLVGSFDDTLGPLGDGDVPLGSIGVSVSGGHVAGVSTTGTELYVAPTEAPDGQVSTVVTGATDLGAPHWDHRDRVWVLDRGAGRATVVVVADGVSTPVRVPGLTGRTVTRLLVSRDGTRLVAVVRGRKTDRVVATRVRHDAAGGILGFTPPQVLPLPEEGSPRIRDIGWRSPTSISVLRTFTDDLSLVRTVSVDGSPGTVETETGGSTIVRGRMRALVSAPVEGSEVFALAPGAIASVTRPERTVPSLPEGFSGLTYVG
ncbi:MAG TPA: LpqB family beta-propeller domain-containing protein [Nocardioides sp.]|nr:LpqB family beta-propeller domain-containing protein [Nocardioides sp.]